MAFNVFHDSTQGSFFVVLIVTGALSIVAVLCRFLATRLSRRRPGLEDWLALAALLVYLLRVGAVLYGLTVINGRGLDLAFDPEAYEKSFKMVFLADMITCLDQSLAKFSICALYYRIMGVYRTYAYWIYGLAAFQAIVNLAIILAQVFMCRPINKFWQWWVEGDCVPFSTFLVALDTPNSLIDFALVILALTRIRSLRLDVGTKLRLSFLFGLGSLAGIFGFVKIGVSYNTDIAYTSAALGLWAAVQSFVTLFCCCAPVYTPLLPNTGFWSRISSKFSTLRLRTISDYKSQSTGTDFTRTNKESQKSDAPSVEHDSVPSTKESVPAEQSDHTSDPHDIIQSTGASQRREDTSVV
ncbi:hypothetical protein GQ53DRAFT_363370 [Thozetella sp. PMI_491]|nr:hypothetical protein GQ53DRAFT_363370 [Thozetella sp. PMI_491]